MSGAWNAALEKQAEMQAYYRTIRGQESLYHMTGDVASMVRLPINDDYRVRLATALLSNVYDSEPYYWSPQMCDLVAQIARTVPDDWRVQPDMVPALPAFMYFAKPIPIMMDDPEYLQYLETEGDAEKVSVQVVALGDSMQTIEQEGGLEVRGVSFSAHIYSVEKGTGRTMPIPMPYVAALWAYGETWAEQLQRDERVGSKLITGAGIECARRASMPTSLDSAGLEDTRKVIAACLTLLQQKIVLPEATVPHRSTRRRVERLDADPPRDIQVVTMRKTHRPSSYEGTGEPINWDHRWYVRPHWHNYWYSAGLDTPEMRPRLLLGYVKGPEDKPLKMDGTRLFNVAR